MADLISPAEKALFFDAIHDVTDTFFKDTVTHHSTKKGFDKFQEGKGKSNVDTTLLCRVTEEKKSGPDGNVELMKDGTKNETDISIAFNAEYLNEQGMMESEVKSKFVVEVDEFTWNGKRYRTQEVTAGDTNFMGKLALIICKCKIIPDKA